MINNDNNADAIENETLETQASGLAHNYGASAVGENSASHIEVTKNILPTNF